MEVTVVRALSVLGNSAEDLRSPNWKHGKIDEDRPGTEGKGTSVVQKMARCAFDSLAPMLTAKLQITRS
jgi:hypothetical protein